MDQTDPIPDITADIAAQLGETDPVPLSQIKRMVLRLGEEQARAFLAEALKIQAEGGLTHEIDGEKRQRTLGGIFFKVAKDKVKSNDRYFIWLRPNQKKIPRMTWEDRLACKPALAQQEGEATTVKITLIGRPGKIIEKGNVVITSLKSEKAPSLSKQLPPVPDHATNYVVFIAKKQWKKVADAIKDPDDSLIIEGYPVVDSQMRGITVFAQNATTKLLQRGQRD